MSRAEAAQVVKMIERLDGLAALQPAIENGLVSMSNARMIAEAITSTARREAATTDEAKLIELASTLTPVHLRRELDRWGRTIDQSVGDATAEDLRAQRSLETSKRASGMTEITARLDPESADLVATAIEARMKAEWDHETENGTRCPHRNAAARRRVHRDLRRLAQRNRDHHLGLGRHHAVPTAHQHHRRPRHPPNRHRRRRHRTRHRPHRRSRATHLLRCRHQPHHHQRPLPSDRRRTRATHLPERRPQSPHPPRSRMPIPWMQRPTLLVPGPPSQSLEQQRTHRYPQRLPPLHPPSPRRPRRRMDHHR